MSFSTLIDLEDVKVFLLRASAEEKAELQKLLEEKTTGVVPSTPAAMKKKPAEMPVPPLPEGNTQPDASAYRLPSEQIVEDVCVGRVIRDSYKDSRWSIAIYRESQCGAVCEADEDLCKACLEREARYLADPKPGRWHGRVTEEPLDWQHMLGTAWAETRMASGKLKWMPGSVAVALVPAGGAGDDGSETASTVSTPSVAQMKAALRAEAAVKKAAETEAKKLAKAVEAEAKKAAKTLEKEAKAAAKEAEKAAKEDEKERVRLEKAAAKAAKEAEKEAAKAAKEVEKEAAKAAKAAAKKKSE
jgi:chemotaxis protein histidine kinase CheA